MPLVLIPKERTCLVVGAGKTGCWKALSLAEAGANVLVVAPTAIGTLQEVLTRGRVTWRQAAFEESDLDGVSVAFAATDKPDVNSAVLAACRRRGVLCGIVDNGWREGDFISPAVVRREGLIVAVSTGGRSCRRARMVKASLARHIDTVSTADLLVLGTDHRHLPSERRDALQLGGERLAQIGEMLAQVWGVHEFALIDTAERIELHAVVSARPGVESLLRHLLGFDRLADAEYYALRGMAAMEHSAMLLAGLLSQTPGESGIVATTERAFAAAAEAGWAERMMKEWLASALDIAGDLRENVRPASPPENVGKVPVVRSAGSIVRGHTDLYEKLLRGLGEPAG